MCTGSVLVTLGMFVQFRFRHHDRTLACRVLPAGMQGILSNSKTTLAEVELIVLKMQASLGGADVKELSRLVIAGLDTLTEHVEAP